jgi:hypothetical protein
MADIVRVQTSVTYIQETPPANNQLLNTVQDQIPESYNHGAQRIDASITDYQLASNVNLIVLNCSSNFDVKVGATTNPALTTKSFMYNGAAVDVFITNSGTEPIDISYVTSAV